MLLVIDHVILLNLLTNVIKLFTSVIYECS
jgi:hypothetical protein